MTAIAVRTKMTEVRQRVCSLYKSRGYATLVRSTAASMAKSVDATAIAN